jgi:hypothetical protein
MITLVPGQEDRGTTSGSSHTPTLPSNVTAGNLLVMVIARGDNPGSEPTVSDAVNGTWTAGPAFDLGGTLKAYIFYVRNTLGGFNATSVVWSGGVTASSRELFEFTGQSNSLPVVSGQTSVASGTSHAQADAVDHVSGTGLYVGCSPIGNVVTTTYTTGWTHQNSGAAPDCIQYTRQTATDETAPFTIDVSSPTVSVLALFPEDSERRFLLVR